MEIGRFRHQVTWQNPTLTDDGDGGTTVAWANLAPSQSRVSIVPATAQSLERTAGGAAVISSATHIVTGRYHAGVTTKTRIVFGSRTFQVVSVANIEERSRKMVLLCQEVVS